MDFIAITPPQPWATRDCQWLSENPLLRKLSSHLNHYERLRTMYFTDETLDQIRTKYGTIERKYEKLLLAYVGRRFVQARAKEFATHGFARRLRLLTRGIHKVFQIFPPERTQLPSQEELADAVINIQAFV